MLSVCLTTSAQQLERILVDRICVDLNAVIYKEGIQKDESGETIRLIKTVVQKGYTLNLVQLSIGEVARRFTDVTQTPWRQDVTDKNKITYYHCYLVIDMEEQDDLVLHVSFAPSTRRLVFIYREKL